ncbi:glucuronate isomerase [Francisella adeliensis]|uniref:Uronate isomerase n=1 Tax=Francisella adeliensis TaxID=2007306 RepID=A0A2Z4XWP1_9GAMM|nr:glucuronate isomerase [Francisella adeliensis]AXA33291.1 glucuronate isomerase [Francisella adeliensis]MBK2084981.1 glucuronate isomerase [Francisella adeliensis]MBK2097027.1 glucuronate isomerase [Francisella adeliensis]QIW11519.1 glucuronate isomerase [Francisella adeliensis]QIW13394.1 glucuronate isomerase [Francisella adeliensis]
MLDENVLMPTDKQTRGLALEIYNHIKELPIISPHGHTDPAWFDENKPFENPVELLIKPDHYIFRMFYSQGLRLEDFGIDRKDGKQVETDPRKIWQKVAENWYLFRGTQVGLWFDAQLKDVFGFDKPFTPVTADELYDHIDNCLKQKEFLPREICKKFNIKAIATTDDVGDDLQHHKNIAKSSFDCKIVPTFRPDSVTNPELHPVHKNIKKLAKKLNTKIDTYSDFLKVLAERREYFKANGATASDHGVTVPETYDLDKSECKDLFKKIISNTATDTERRIFSGQMLTEMAKMATNDGLVMQIHAGVFRNHNQSIQRKFGNDKGCDIPVKCDYVNGLHPLLTKIGNNRNFKVVLFTMDETVYTRELAPLAGHYPSVFLGPPWWFNDSPEGMKRFRHAVTEVAGFYNCSGFIDDTRALLSIPVRHDIARRVDATYLAEMVLAGRLSKTDAFEVAYDLTYTQNIKVFNFDRLLETKNAN